MTKELEAYHESSPALPSHAFALISGGELAVSPSPLLPKEAAFLREYKEDDEDDSSSDDSDFTFASVSNPDELPDVTADELFSGGRIVPAYPLFNRDLLLPHDASEEADEQIPIRRLLVDDVAAAGDYCVWSPKSAPQSPGRWKKSSSAGAGRTRRWRLSDLVGRSHSDGKEKFVFIDKATAAKEKGANSGDRAGKDGRRSAEADMAAVHRLYYGKQGSGQAARRSYLPYRQELYALFTPPNGVSLKPHRF